MPSSLPRPGSSVVVAAEPFDAPEFSEADRVAEDPLIDVGPWESWFGLRPVAEVQPDVLGPEPAEPTAIVVSRATTSRAGVQPAKIRRAWTVARTILLLCADLVSAQIASTIARGARFEARQLPRNVSTANTGFTISYALVGMLMIVGWVGVLAAVGAHHKRRFSSLWNQGTAIVRASVGLLALVGVASLFTRLQLARSYVATAIVALVVVTFLGRCVVAAAFSLLMRVGILADRVVLIGEAAHVDEIRRHLERTSQLRVRVVDSVAFGSGSTVDIEAVVEVANRRGLTSVIICGQSTLSTASIRRLGTALSDVGVSLVVAPGTTEALGPALELHPIGDLVLLRVTNAEPRVAARFAKACIDRIGAFLALLLGAPVLLAVAVAVVAEGRPILFRQTRVGAHGRRFRIYKFRTMAPDAEARLQREGLYDRYVANGFKLPADEDPRITRTGRFLRRTSLDELPQLINVLLGQMSLVGPRPVVEKELECYGPLVGAYTGVKPGVTGYWQVNGRSDVGFPERGELDAYYYDHRSLRFDLRILARTALTVILRRGAH